MINRKSKDEIKRMRHAGHIVALVHQEMKKVVEPGISTMELDDIAMRIIKENKAIPTFLGYSGFPASICTSINEKVVHGIPSKDEILKEGDIIAIDVGATYGGMVGDSAWSYAVGKISPEKERLMKKINEAPREVKVVDDSQLKELQEKYDSLVSKHRLMGEENRKLSKENEGLKRDVAHLTKKIDKNRSEIILYISIAL